MYFNRYEYQTYRLIYRFCLVVAVIYAVYPIALLFSAFPILSGYLAVSHRGFETLVMHWVVAPAAGAAFFAVVAYWARRRFTSMEWMELLIDGALAALKVAGAGDAPKLLSDKDSPVVVTACKRGDGYLVTITTDAVVRQVFISSTHIKVGCCDPDLTCGEEEFLMAVGYYLLRVNTDLLNEEVRMAHAQLAEADVAADA